MGTCLPPRCATMPATLRSGCEELPCSVDAIADAVIRNMAITMEVIDPNKVRRCFVLNSLDLCTAKEDTKGCSASKHPNRDLAGQRQTGGRRLHAARETDC